MPHVYLLDPSGATPPTRLLEAELALFRNVGRIMWHPDGKRVSFTATKGQGTEFLTQPIAGGPAVASALSEQVQRGMKQHGVAIANAKWAPAGDALYVEGVWHGVINLWKIDADHTSESVHPRIRPLGGRQHAGLRDGTPRQDGDGAVVHLARYRSPRAAR